MKRFRNLLVVCDRELSDSRALNAALQIAEDNNAAITLLQVLPPLTALQTFAKPQTPEQMELSYRNFYLNKLQQLTNKFADKALIRCKVVVGTGFIETIRAVLRNQHDLVVKVAESVSWIKRLFGSNDMHLLRKCPCPLWILAPDAPLELKRVVATIDLPMPGMTDGHRSDGHRSDGHRSDAHRAEHHRRERQPSRPHGSAAERAKHQRHHTDGQRHGRARQHRGAQRQRC